MTDPINVACEMCGSSAGEQCRTVKGRAKAFCKARGQKFAPVEQAVPARPNSAPDDFDESTPPPRRRPEGQPIGCDLVLGPGEDLKSLFAAWDKAGRIPAKSLLCEFIGTQPFGAGTASGYKLLAVGAGVSVFAPPGKRELTSVDLGAYRITSWIDCRPSVARRFVVFSPKEGS